MALDTNLQSAFTAVGTAVKGKISSSEKGVANGVATLDGTGKIPSGQLPSYVDDVVEYANLGTFPATGSAGILYIALDSNKQYRWAGSTYQQITSGAVDSVAGRTGVVTLVKGDVGLANVDNTADSAKPVSTAQATALDLKVDKVAGKGLSTEDYSTAEKTKLSGIAAGAEVNTVTSVASKTGAVTLVKGDVGLGNVDNTTDLLKPISTATQSALDLKASASSVSTLSTNIGATDTNYVAVFNAALV